MEHSNWWSIALLTPPYSTSHPLDIIYMMMRPGLICLVLLFHMLLWTQTENNNNKQKRLGLGVRNEEGIWSAEAISSLLKMCMAQSLGRYGGISSPDSVFISLWWYLSQLCNIWGWWFLLASFPGPHPAPHQLSRRGPGRFSYVSEWHHRQGKLSDHVNHKQLHPHAHALECNYSELKDGSTQRTTWE